MLVVQHTTGSNPETPKRGSVSSSMLFAGRAAQRGVNTQRDYAWEVIATLSRKENRRRSLKRLMSGRRSPLARTFELKSD